jgi:hypothetical protein
MRPCDEFDGGFGWIEDERLRRTSHALVADGRVWLIDPVDHDDLDERVRAAGEPAGVIQLLDRHNRDCTHVAGRLGVPLHYLAVPAPFEAVRIGTPPKWSEIALWWPERRVLVRADALGTVPNYFAVGGERLGVHPLLRLTPPRRLGRLRPERVLVGHGEGIHDGAAAALDDALNGSRRRIPALLQGVVQLLRQRGK